MTELKTLKDIEDRFAKDGYDHYKGKPTDIIREEAIKWVKELESKEKSPNFLYSISGYPYGEPKNNNVRDWIVDFFNITDEDLK